jgi:hypothetical protein
LFWALMNMSGVDVKMDEWIAAPNTHAG